MNVVCGRVPSIGIDEGLGWSGMCARLGAVVLTSSWGEQELGVGAEGLSHPYLLSLSTASNSPSKTSFHSADRRSHSSARAFRPSAQTFSSSSRRNLSYSRSKRE